MELLALAMAAKTAEELKQKNYPEKNPEKNTTRTELSLEFSQALGLDVRVAVGLGWAELSPSW